MASTAVRAAIDLLHVPSRVRLQRHAPLPDGVVDLLKIATGDVDAEQIVAAELGREPATVRSAASFYIEQILLNADADSYRVLGASPDASAVELRRNMAMLISWLHPDKMSEDQRSVFAARVTKAWDNLKTPERRTEYDKQLADMKAAETARSVSWPTANMPSTFSPTETQKGRSTLPVPGRPKRFANTISCDARPMFLRRLVDRLLGRTHNQRG